MNWRAAFHSFSHVPHSLQPMDYTIHGILQARILEWVAFPFSRGSSQPRDQIQVSHIAGRFFTSWATKEAQEYWSGLPCPPSGHLPNPGTEPKSPTLQADSLPAEPPGEPKDSGMGSLSLLQGIFPTQSLNLRLPHCRQILYQLSHKGSPQILKWVAYPFSSRSSQPRNWTGVSCIAGGFFTNWAMWEA